MTLALKRSRPAGDRWPCSASWRCCADGWLAHSLSSGAGSRFASTVSP